MSRSGTRTNLVVWGAVLIGTFLVLEPAEDVNGGILVEYAATYNGLGGLMRI